MRGWGAGFVACCVHLSRCLLAVCVPPRARLTFRGFRLAVHVSVHPPIRPSARSLTRWSAVLLCPPLATASCARARARDSPRVPRVCLCAWVRVRVHVCGCARACARALAHVRARVCARVQCACARACARARARSRARAFLFTLATTVMSRTHNNLYPRLFPDSCVSCNEIRRQWITTTTVQWST